MSEEATVRLLSFDSYENLLEKLRDSDSIDEPRAVVGTQAPARDWGDMVADWVSLVGFSGVRDFALEHDPGVDAVDEDGDLVDVGYDDCVLEDTPHNYHDQPTIDVIDGVKRIGDVAFPAYGFADQDSSDELENAETMLIGTTIFPGEQVRDAHPSVQTFDDLLETVDELRDEFDPDDHAIIVGAWSPDGGYSITTDGPVHRTGDTIFPADAFQTSTGMDSIMSGNGALYGTIIVERDALSDDALRLVTGDADEIAPPDEADQGVEA